jgi:tetratricopeptide (TPR) repeat protein
MTTRRLARFSTAACAVLVVAACSKDKGKEAPAGDPGPAATAKPTADQPPPGAGARIPITTASEEARALYLEGYQLLTTLRAADARPKFEAALAKDPKFALAHVGMANTSPTNKEFFASVEQAVALAPAVSDAERLWIEGVAAGAKNDPAGQRAAYEKLVAIAPGDPQAYNLLGNVQFGRQEYAAAIETFNKAIAIDPKFSQPYNQLGYAYRFLGKLDDAERTFKQYIELIPNDPNPYDSYAELLMKRGKFDESIASYEKALSVDPNFVASYIGISIDHSLAGRGDDARKVLAKLTSIARNPAEQRQALFWTSVSYTHEGKWDEAVAAVDQMQGIAAKAGDLALEAADHNTRGDLLLAAGKPDAAAKEFAAQLEVSAKSSVPDEVKAAVRRNGLYDQARVALAKGDVTGAKAKLDEYANQVAAKQIPFEVRQQQELTAMLAIEDKQFAAASAALAKANQQDPQVLYLQGVALAGAGDGEKARAAYQAAYDFNGIAGNLGYVRAKAKAALAAK